MSKTDNEPGLMLVKGDDRMVMKSCSNPSDIHNWAGLLYIAVAHANGGNDASQGRAVAFSGLLQTRALVFLGEGLSGTLRVSF